MAEGVGCHVTCVESKTTKTYCGIKGMARKHINNQNPTCEDCISKWVKDDDELKAVVDYDCASIELRVAARNGLKPDPPVTGLAALYGTGRIIDKKDKLRGLRVATFGMKFGTKFRPL